ncbi:MAG: phospholipase D-like domain-containing protein [Candidatus Micrarchaeia archaeon]
MVAHRISGKGHEYDYGDRSYVAVDKLIKESKSLCIISPYIDEYYAKYLVKHAKGKRIRIISSSISRRAEKRLARRSLKRLAAFLLAVAMLNYALAGSGIEPLVGMASVLCSSAYVLVYLSDATNKMGISLKTPRQFVHAKLYIGDNFAVEGSANLTFAGMHKNIEQTRRIENSEEVQALRNDFERLWRTLE